ncbi:MAG: hypothetical protein J6A06_00525 [Fibrobacteraceae bacterium]|nr:hypothetical protein [Fibrobacteraceae bacterium]
MSYVATIAISLIISLILVFDLIALPKNSKAIIRSFVYLVTVSVPALAKAGNLDINNATNIFYIVFALSIIIAFIGFYFGDFKKLLHCIEDQGLNGLNYTFTDYLLMGRIELRKKIEQNVFNGEHFKKVQNDLKQTSLFNKKMASLISLAYLTMNDDDDYHNYCKRILSNFSTIFFGTSNSRFTLRKLSDNRKEMIADVCSDDSNSPSAIPIRGKSLIKLSKEQEKPVIYSRNKNHHYDTKKSIKNKIFDDYVSYCLIKTPDKKCPAYSVCLEVKGKEAQNSMKNLVDSNIFTILCKAMEYKISSEINSNQSNVSTSGESNGNQ